jgi:threonine aldolase
VLGGGWRQAGILAAAGLFALEHNVPKLALDHQNAQMLARGLSEIPGIRCRPELFPTNIIYFEVQSMPADELVRQLREDYNIHIGSK